MKKKTYITPESVMIESVIESHLLDGSWSVNGNKPGTDQKGSTSIIEGNPEGPLDAKGMGSYDLWEDEDNY